MNDDSRARWGIVAAAIAPLFDPVVLLEPVYDNGELADFRYLFINEAACAYNGLTAEQTIGRGIRELLDPDMVNTIMPAYTKVLRTGEPFVEHGRGYYTPSKGQVRTADSLCILVEGVLVVSWRDLTDLERAVQAAQESYERIGAVLHAHIDPHLILRAVSAETGVATDFLIDDANEAAARDMGVPRARLINATMTGERAMHCESIDLALFQRVLFEGGTAVLNDEQTRRHTSDTQPSTWVDVRITRLDREHLLYTWRDATDRHVAQQRLADSERRLRGAVATDELTGLANRRALHDQLPAILNASVQAGGTPAVIFCDLDDFKAVNDEHGHDAGDLVLRTVATRLRSAVQPNDLVVRLAGDEILAVISSVTRAEDALHIAQQLREAVSVPMELGAIALHVTGSFGVCIAEPDDTVSALLTRADAAMYAAKRAGRDRVALA